MIQKKCALCCPLWFSLLLFFFLLPACSEAKASRNTQKLRIVSWNVQNLFDLQWRGTEYPEFDPRPQKSGAPGKWTAELLQYRLKKLSAILEQLDADVYALIEVESETVLKQLNAELANPFPYFLLLRQRDQSVNMGLLSRLPIVRSARHEVGFLASNRSLRAIIEVVLELPKRRNRDLKKKKDLADTNPREQLIVLLNHWKSQRGGVAKTAAARRKAAALLSQRGKELQQKMATEGSAQNYIIALGDFNEPIDSHWRDSSEHQKNLKASTSSFLPWQTKEAIYIRAKPFQDPSAESFEPWSNSWFSPWFIYACVQKSNQGLNQAELKDWHTWPQDCLNMGKLPKNLGSYAFRGKWQTIDHIFLNSAFFSEENFWHFANFDVARFPALLKESEDGQIPKSWRNDQGVSDHLPIILELEGNFQK